MIEISQDSKAPKYFTITRTYRKGFHHQLTLTGEELQELIREAKANKEKP